MWEDKGNPKMLKLWRCYYRRPKQKGYECCRKDELDRTGFKITWLVQEKPLRCISEIKWVENRSSRTQLVI